MRVLITSRLVSPGSEADLLFQEARFETVINHKPGSRTEEEMMALVKGIDGVVAGLDAFTPRVFSEADRLKVVARTGVGYDAIDVAAATARGIAVCNTPGANRHAVAEYTFALILQCSRKMIENLAEVRKGSWGRHEGMDLAGRTLGIVGLGTIGKEVAQRARAFEMRILAYDLYPDAKVSRELQVSYVSLEQLLRESDFVTLHCFLDEKSRHLINAERLAMMKPTSYLINTARGPVVDSEALYQALKNRAIAGAALDVFDQEPLGESPLRELDNIYLSPHASAITADASAASVLMATDNVIRVLRGEKCHHVVNPEVFHD